ncbi:MAG: GntR family transcriptional regulator [Chloroflexi bacterium]|nr:MAG: GntR family transcriptional regulator [Chloroflexota bacterium]
MAVAEQVEARSQSEVAYARILERIVSLEMPPGSVVNEARLRDELGIGRTPIREALQRLARENLVKSVPHRGTFVTDVNLTDLARITEVRVVLEAHAARLATEKLAAADRESIEELLELLARGYVTDQRDLMQLDQRIHRTVYRAARNPFLESTLERYFNLSLRLWYLVLDRDVELAETMMRRHVIGFESEIRRLLVEG